jgi:hypothetical protein
MKKRVAPGNADRISARRILGEKTVFRGAGFFARTKYSPAEIRAVLLLTLDLADRATSALFSRGMSPARCRLSRKGQAGLSEKARRAHSDLFRNLVLDTSAFTRAVIASAGARTHNLRLWLSGEWW